MWNRFKNPLPYQEVQHYKCPHESVNEIAFFQYAVLDDGHWTSFAVLKCFDCGLILGFPQANFDDARKNGTAKTKAKLQSLGVSLLEEPNNEYNPSSRMEH